MDTTRDFTSGPIVGPLIRFSMPILAALFLQALYGAVDLLVVGKYAATADVSGVAVGSQIMMTVTGLISSLAMGSTILLGQKLGMRAEKDCGSVIGASAAFFWACGICPDAAASGSFRSPGKTYECTAGGFPGDAAVHRRMRRREPCHCRLQCAGQCDAGTG